MKMDDVIARINELARKNKAEGLNQEELAERDKLRRIYIDSVKANLVGHLENTTIVRPDGSKEPSMYDYRLEFEAENIWYALTAPSGWEWFNSVRNEDRFKEYVERAKKMADSKKK